MLPKSSGNCAGNISCWKWMQIGWNCKFAPQFDPLKVSWLVKHYVRDLHVTKRTCSSGGRGVSVGEGGEGGGA